MLRICRQCSAQYEGSPGSSLCPDCVAQNRKNVIRDRICRGCGTAFPGGPRAWYCPACRRERPKEASRRNSHGAARPLGSTDTCTVCGMPYTVNSGRQRYCPACAKEAAKASDRIQARDWYDKHKDPQRRREQRQDSTAPIRCRVCGKSFVPDDASVTCSAECSRELQRQRSKQYEASHRQERNAAQRKRWAQKKGDNQ